MTIGLTCVQVTPGMQDLSLTELDLKLLATVEFHLIFHTKCKLTDRFAGGGFNATYSGGDEI